jgi:hypothetical protein
VVTKAAKEFVDQSGQRKVKGNMDIELAIDAMEIAPHIDQMVLFSGDGNFRSLVEAVQRRGVRGRRVHHLDTAADGRSGAASPGRRVHRHHSIAKQDRPRSGRSAGARTAGEPRHTPQFLQRTTGTQIEAGEDEFDED